MESKVKNFTEMNIETALHSSVFLPSKIIGKYFWNTQSSSVFKVPGTYYEALLPWFHVSKYLEHTLKHCHPNLVRWSRTDTQISCVKSTMTMKPAVQEHYITKYLPSSLCSVQFCLACSCRTNKRRKIPKYIHWL